MKILLIEHKNNFAKKLSTSLEQQTYTLEVVGDTKEAQIRLSQFNDLYDLVIIDLPLTDTGPENFIEYIRKKNSRVRILVLSQDDNIEERIKALDSGADDYVLKPFSLGELSARIRALLRRPDETTPFKIEIGKTIIEINNSRVYRDGEEIALTSKEFAIFDLLIHRPNQILSREQIFDHVWAFDSNTISNVVDVHIKNLRRKLHSEKDKNGNINLIETVWGFGYRFRNPKKASDAKTKKTDENNMNLRVENSVSSRKGGSQTVENFSIT